MPDSRSKPWFAPKRYGYGSGLPIAWQGWVVLLVYMAVTIGGAVILPFALPRLPVFLPVFAGLVIFATVVLFVICARKTEGGWRWRWDGKP